MKFHCDSTLVALSSQCTSVYQNVAIVKPLILSLGVYCVPKISICSWFVAVENSSGWWLDAFLVCLPSCGSLLFRWSEVQGEMPGSLGMEGREEKGGGGVHVLDERPDCAPPAAPGSANIHETVYTLRHAERWEMKEAKQKAMKGGRRKWKLYNRTEKPQTEREREQHSRRRSSSSNPVQRFISAWQPESLRQGFGFERWHLPACNFQLLPRPGEANSQLETPECISDSKVWFNSLASLFTATALIIAAVLMLRSQGSDNGA